MNVDVQELSAEIRQIDTEYRETNERLRDVYGRGRGRGRLRGRGRGRGFPRDLPREDSGRWNEAEGGFPAPRVASAISGMDPDDVQRDFIPPVILKRPATHGMDDDPKLKNRNRRIFSFLQSTLEKAREENDVVENSERWKKREEISRRAEQRTAEESQRLREKQRREWEEQKLQETERLKELNLMRKVKALQLRYAKRMQHSEELLPYLFTTNCPAIGWIPAKHNPATQAMMDAKAAEHASWKETQREQFEKDREKIEKGEPLEKEPSSAEMPKIRSTIHVAKKEETESAAGRGHALPAELTRGVEDGVELEFQPVSEVNNDPPDAKDDTPAAKKPRLNQGDEK